jgi:hypothetical protein
MIQRYMVVQMVRHLCLTGCLLHNCIIPVVLDHRHYGLHQPALIVCRVIYLLILHMRFDVYLDKTPNGVINVRYICLLCCTHVCLTIISYVNPIVNDVFFDIELGRCAIITLFVMYNWHPNVLGTSNASCYT